jgi:putative nucleotidyltransferase with HDIG domain
VSHDQALTAKTLRLANSSLYGLQVKVTTIQQAITFLGFQTTRNLITAAAVTGCFAERPVSGLRRQGLLAPLDRHRRLRQGAGAAMRFNQDYAFTAGLLHDIGRLVLVSGHPGQYTETMAYREAHDCYLLEAERAVLGVDHVDAGVALAEHWNFSDTMRLAIAHHHAPEAPGAGFLAAIVHVANAIVHALDLAGEERRTGAAGVQRGLDRDGLERRNLSALFRETELQFEEMSAILLTEG